jgi:hypothetical protein
MKKLAKFVVTFAAAALMSSSALATVSFSDNFESYPIFEGVLSDIGGGWVFYVNVYGNYPGCTDKWYDYGGPYPAPNGPQISNIVEGSTGHALNKFSDYNNGDHDNGACIETNVFQERVISSTDAGSYTFTFDTQVPMELGVDVSTFGFIKLLDPNNGYSLDLYDTVSTATAGAKFINVTLGPSDQGKILQWGFTDTASNYEPSGRYYDNVRFNLRSGSYLGEEGVPIPLWALIFMGGLLALVGASRLRRRRT